MVASRSVRQGKRDTFHDAERAELSLSNSTDHHELHTRASDTDFQSEQAHLESTKARSLEHALVALRIIIEQRGRDVSGLDLRGISDIADYFIITSATSERHAKGLADRIVLELKKYAERPLRICGKGGGKWIILDYGDFIIHICNEADREFYRLDELWGNAQKIQLPPDLEQEAKKLRTGMFR